MITALEDYRRIARVTTVQRDPRAGTVMAWLAALLGLGLAAGTLFAVAHHKLNLVILARAAVGMAGCWLGLVWGIMFIPGSVLINSAVNARLLPRQRRRLMQMAVIGWLACTLAMAITLDNWAVVPIAGIYLIGLSLVFAGHRHALVPVVIAGNSPLLARTALPHSLVETLTSQPSLVALTVLLLPAGALALRLLYPAGGDAYLAQRDAQVRRVQRFSNGQGAGVTDLGDTGGLRFRRLYSAMLRRDCRKRDPATLLMHVLGPVAHWSAWLSSMGMILLISVGIRAAMTWNMVGQVRDALIAPVAGASGAMVMLILFSTAAFGQQLRRTRGEQALLRLTPRAGDTALLNRRLAGRLLERTLQIWLALVVVFEVAIWLVGGDGQALLRQFALCCVAGQVALMGLLGDFAREAGWNWMLGLRAALLAAVEVAVAVGLGWLTGPSAWPWLIVIAAVGAAVQVRLGWRRMLAAPVAFPAERLG